MFGAPWVATNLVLSVAILALAVLVQKLSTFCYNYAVLQVHGKGKTEMRSISAIILHAFIAQVAAKDLANQGISDEDLKALKDIDTDKFVDMLETKLVHRLMHSPFLADMGRHGQHRQHGQHHSWEGSS